MSGRPRNEFKLDADSSGHCFELPEQRNHERLARESRIQMQGGPFAQRERSRAALHRSRVGKEVERFQSNLAVQQAEADVYVRPDGEWADCEVAPIMPLLRA